MQNKDKDDGIEDSPLYMLLVILLEGASKEVVTPSSLSNANNLAYPIFICLKSPAIWDVKSRWDVT